RSAGWELAGARAWVAQRLELRHLGRTTALTRGYRAQSALARALADLLPGAAPDGVATALLADRPAVEFVVVPSVGEPRLDARRPGEPDLRRGGGTATLAPRLRAARGGAGVEIDLSGLPGGQARGLPRRHEGLPAELRA